MPTQREILMEIVRRAREDREFFHALVFNSERALASLEGLDETTQNRLRAISPDNFLVPQLVQTISPQLPRCDPTCDDSCGVTCGALSCDLTCGPDAGSCGQTCSASCGRTLSRA